MIAPRCERSLRLGGFAEDKADQDVEASYGEKEECRNEREGVDVM